MLSAIVQKLQSSLEQILQQKEIRKSKNDPAVFKSRRLSKVQQCRFGRGLE